MIPVLLRLHNIQRPFKPAIGAVAAPLPIADAAWTTIFEPIPMMHQFAAIFAQPHDAAS